MLLDILFFALAMGALIYFADLLIDSSEKIAFYYKLSPFIIGATLVALGTSLPEMAISISATLDNKTDMAVSNVVGSYTFNIGLVLGVALLLTKQAKLKREFFTKDSLWVIAPLFVFVLMALDGELNYIDGILFLCVMGGYLLFLFTSDKKAIEVIDECNEATNHNPNLDKKKDSIVLAFLLSFVGLAGILLGAYFSVEYAQNIAYALGVSEWVVGILVLAIGSSLPELIVSIKAALKNNLGLAFGAIVGSNVVNFAAILGVSSIIATLPIHLDEIIFDIATAFVVAFMLIFIMATKAYNRASGILLVVVTMLFIKNSIGL